MTPTRKKESRITFSELRAAQEEAFDWNRLANKIGKSTTEPPAGAITIREFGEKMGFGTSASTRHLESLVESGEMERGTFRRARRWIRFYWWKKK